MSNYLQVSYATTSNLIMTDGHKQTNKWLFTEFTFSRTVKVYRDMGYLT